MIAASFSPTGQTMPSSQTKIAAKTDCATVSCANCGIFQLCHSVGGDTDLSVLDTIVKSRKTIKRGESLYRAGDTFRAIYAIRGGVIKTSISASDGGAQITGFHVAGEVLGLDAITAGRHSCGAIAIETASVCEVPYALFKELGKDFPDLPYKMLEIMSRDIRHNHELMLLLGKKNAEERLASYLLNLSNRMESRSFSATQLNMNMSRSDIGNYLGLAEETVCRTFSRFQEEGLLTIQRRQVILNDLARLKIKASRG
jgi:CRP/FNR family transcriptional regulator